MKAVDIRAGEKIAAAGAALAFLASAAIYRPGGEGEPVRPEPVRAQLGDAADPVDGVPVPWDSARRDRPAWKNPAAQSAGPGWIYEVFTPPAVHYDERTSSFQVTPPDGGASERMLPGVELLAVQPELFRLQLVGYCGTPGDWRAIFTNPAGNETVLAQPGARLAGWDLAFEEFDEEKQLVAQGEPARRYGGAAVARLLDLRTGHEVVLRSGERLHTERAVAVMRFMAGDGSPRELPEGATWVEGPVTYRLERIQLEPPEVWVVRSDGMSSEPIYLRLASPGGDPPGRAQDTDPARQASAVAAIP